MSLIPGSAGEKLPSQAEKQADASERMNPELAPALAQFTTATSLVNNAKSAASLPHYRKALSLAPRDRFPQTWALIQFDLGAALFNASAGDLDASGHQLQEEALTALRASQGIFTKEANLQQWVKAQTLLAYTLFCMRDPSVRNGDAPGDSSEAAAVAAIRAILEVVTLEKFPEEWSRAQMDLASFLTRQAEANKRRSAEPLLLNALAALDTLTAFHPRQTMPKEWAEIQTQRGRVHLTWSKFGQPSEKATHLDTAEMHFKASLEIQKDRDPISDNISGMEDVQRRKRSLQKSKR